jgi:uncharacterized protein (TIRG00374 family)
MIDSGQTKPKPSFKKYLWQYLPVLVILGLAIYLLLPQLTTLEKSWWVVQNLTWWAVMLAIIAETISWIGNGIVLHAILNSNKQKLSIAKGTLIAIGTLSLSLAAGGWVGLAATVSWVHNESKDGNSAVLAGTLPAFLNNGVLVVIAMIGTVLLLLLHVLRRFQLYEFGLIFIILGGITVLALIALNNTRLTTRIAVWVMGKWAAIRHRPYDANAIITLMEQFFVAVSSLRKGRWLRPLVGAAINIGFDMIALYFLFIGAGNQVTPGVLVAGYGLPLVLGKMAFMFPGGVGVIERSMTALFTKLLVPKDISAVVVLGYRLLSFWIPAVLGFVAAAFLSGKFFRKKGVR